MRLKCAIVSRILAQRTAGDTLPAWVSRHMSHCDSCASEAAAYALMQSAIREAAGPVEPLSLTWQELRSTLPMTPPARRVPILAMAGAAAAIVAAVVLSVSLMPHNAGEPGPIVSKPEPGIRHTQDQPEQVVEQPRNDSRPPVAPAVESRPSPKPVRKPIHPPRLQVEHNAPAPSPAVDNEPAAMAGITPAEPPGYTMVAAEEHVINVVDATTVSDTTDTDYVIRTSDAGDQRPAVLL